MTWRHMFSAGAVVVLLVVIWFSSTTITQAVTASGHAASSPQPLLTVNATALNSRVSPLMFGQDLYYPNSGRTLFADNKETTYDANMLGLVQAMHASVFRCGGGLDSEWYHWVYGIGPLSTRVKTRMTHLKVLRVDDFGTDECLRYAETLGATAIMQVDTNDYPTGSRNPWNPQATSREAAAWVAYVNGSPSNTTTIGVDEHGTDWKTVGYWAQQRVANGHAAPYGIHYWEIGNEDYTISGQDGTHYGQRFLAFANAMKAVDPTIKTGAVLFNDQPTNIWNTQVPQTAGPQIDFVIDHDYPMGDASMERFFSPQTITRTVAFPVTASGTYTINLMALSYYGSAADSHMTFTIDNASFSADILPSELSYDNLTFTVPGSQLSTSGIHTVTIQLTTVQHLVDIFKDLTVNGTTYPLFTGQDVYQNLLATLQRVNWYLDGLRATITSAGLSPSVPMFITEYNVEFSSASPMPTYSGSLLSGMTLMKYIEHGMGMASMWVLSESRPRNWETIASNIDKTGRTHWRFPQDYGFEIVRHHIAPYLLGTTITNNPLNPSGAPFFDIIATKDLTNNVLHMVISNSSYGQNVATTVNIVNGSPTGPATVNTLNAPSLLSTSSSPTKSQITITTQTLSSLAPSFAYTFPAHSITTFDVALMPGVLFGPASGTITNTGTLFTVGDSSWHNYKVSYSFTPVWSATSHDQHTGVQVRYTAGSPTWGQVLFRPTGVAVVQHTASGYAKEIPVSSVAIPSGTANLVTLMIYGNNVAIYLNGTRLGSANLSALPLAGGVQFYAYYASSVGYSNALVGT